MSLTSNERTNVAIDEAAKLINEYPHVIKMQFLLQDFLSDNAATKLGRAMHDDYRQGISDALWFLYVSRLVSDDSIQEYMKLFGSEDENKS